MIFGRIARKVGGKTQIVPLRHYAQAATAPEPVRRRGGGFFVTKYIPEKDNSEDQIPLKIIRRKPWSTDEEQKLKALVLARKPGKLSLDKNDWDEISRSLPGRTPAGCKHKLRGLVKKGKLKALVLKDEERKKDEELIYNMRLVARQWGEIVQSFGGKYTAEQCRVMYKRIYIRKTARSVKAMANRESKKEEVAETGAGAEPGAEPLQEDAGPSLVWGQAENDKLLQLLRVYRAVDYGKLVQHFDGFSKATISRALDKVLCYPSLQTGKWTMEEKTALMKLFNKYGNDWERISEEMPTNRSPHQCRFRYAYLNANALTRARPWTEEESRQLELLVKLHARPKKVTGKHDKPANPTRPALDKDTRPLFQAVSEDSAMSPKLKSLMRALKRDTEAAATPSKQAESQSSDNAASDAVKIDWPLIASYMISRSRTQCYVYWKYVIMENKNSPEIYRGPWSLEEDARLYQLYLEAPRRWVWISRNLPRLRTASSVRIRYVKLIERYVNMLRECRGPEWDPMADGFEEVHERCEIRA
ncbi:hypothetical protein LPJ75_003152, partial [Coemansia sp. RSA 2598]